MGTDRVRHIGFWRSYPKPQSINGSQKVGEFDWVNKTYEKKRTPEEIAFIKFMKGFRARFVPEDTPLIAGEILRKAKRKMRRDTGRRIPI